MSTETTPSGVDVPVDSRADKVEDTVKLVVLIAIMLAALAASFTHMKDWTLHWMPEHTPEWFGWANAVISELVPLVATLSLRKRLRQGKSLWSYALVILLFGAVLSLAAQLSAVGADASWSAKFLACLPSLAFLFLSKLVLGDLDGGRKHAEIEAERQRLADAEAARRAEEVRAARAETAAARRAQAEAEETARAETARAEAETAARVEAETRAAEAETRARSEAETRAEVEAVTEAEIAEHAQAAAEAREAARVAEQRAAAAVEAARVAEGRLAEARDAADRAATARALTEQATAEQVRVLTEAAEQAERDYQQTLAEARYTNQAAQDRVAELDETVRALRAQLDQAQRFAEAQATARALAEQESQAIKDARDVVANELERTRRALARAQEKAETSGGRQPEIARPVARKSLASVPAQLPANLPEVDKVRPETVALILAARAENRNATQTALKEITGISERTISRVLNAVPAEIVDQVLELTSGRVA
ncbi:hypothetical protein GA0070608_0006 [Micromonospora peucetia]|uniref:Uncharacterized protein n=1 Tax=Micromonospora peucetia TaxID=47871 RepID=A0A1C6TUQ1_9ACTN|nr:hypothetical protein GA0070608_0006 [Micromonospora peucetia]